MYLPHLLPYIPAFLSFFIYGYVSGFLFLLWKRSRWGCLLTIIFWYLYAVLCFALSFLVGVQEVLEQTWFVLGVALAFLRPLLQSVAVEHFIEDMRHAGHLGQRAWQALTRSRTKQPKPPAGTPKPAEPTQLQPVLRPKRTGETRRASPPRSRSPRPQG
jgi:hypothetical protein